MADKTPRRKRTAQERAEETLERAQRRHTKATDALTKAEAAVVDARTEVRLAKVDLDYRAADPALPQEPIEDPTGTPKGDIGGSADTTGA